MYWPKFTITPTILKNIAQIESAKAVIDNAPLLPAWENQFREEAAARTVHYGTHLEGNDLSLTQAKKIIEGEKVVGRPRDIQEVLNYRQVLKYLERLQTEPKEVVYSKEHLKKIHALTIQKILPPEQCGKFRKVKVVVKDTESQMVKFIPPPPIEVPYQINEFFSWLNDEPRTKDIHPVLKAGIAHFEIVRIHPFLDGNGRVARAFATLILFREGYDIKRFFSLEEFYDKDAAAYYQNLQNASMTGDLTAWLEYFTFGLSVELSKVKEKVESLSLDLSLKTKLGQQIVLSSRQVKLIRFLKEHEFLDMAQAKKILPMVSEDTILRDLKDLLKKRIILKEGKTKGAKYRLIH